MYKITCAYCGEEITFVKESEKPDTCPNCLSLLGSTPVDTSLENATITEVESRNPNGLTLIYQKTNEEISIPHCNEIVLGRESYGHEVLGKVPQISRRHCKIEFIDGQYRVTDLGSLNGTYVGLSKTDCKMYPQQPLNDSDLLFLGREPFLVKLHYEETCDAEEASAADEAHEPAETIARKKKVYRCLACGMHYESKTEICENCGSYDQWEEVDVE